VKSRQPGTQGRPEPALGQLTSNRVVLATSLVLAGLALASVLGELPRFFDPCHTWDAAQASTVTLAPDATQCQGASASSESRTGAALRLVGVQGTALACAALAAWGGLWGLRAGGLVLALLALPLLLGPAGFVAAGAAGIYLWMGYRPRPSA
jgi:hypothetical protein